eukprot:g7103.t1
MSGLAMAAFGGPGGAPQLPGGSASNIDPALFEQGVREHAAFLGMDPEKDAKYLYIAEQSLCAPIPDGWEQVPGDPPYYYNASTRESVWEHPSDQHFVQLFQKLKAEEQEQEQEHERGYSAQPTWEAAPQSQPQPPCEWQPSGAPPPADLAPGENSARAANDHTAATAAAASPPGAAQSIFSMAGVDATPQPARVVDSRPLAQAGASPDADAGADGGGRGEEYAQDQAQARVRAQAEAQAEAQAQVRLERERATQLQEQLERTQQRLAQESSEARELRRQRETEREAQSAQRDEAEQRATAALAEAHARQDKDREAARNAERLLREQLEASERRGRRAEAGRTTLEEVVQSLKSELETEMEGSAMVRQRGAALQGEVDALSRAAQRTSSEHRQALEEAERLAAARVAKFEEEKTRLARQLEQARASAREATDAAELRARDDVLRAKADAEEAARRVARQLVDAQEEVAALQRQLAAARAESAALREEQHEASEHKAGERKASEEAWTSRVRELETELEAAQAKTAHGHEAAQRQEAEAAERLQALEAQHEKEKKALMKVAEDLDAELQQALSVSSQNAAADSQLQAEIASLRSKLQESEGAAELQHATASAELKEVRSELGQRSKELADRTAQLAQANASANELQVELERQLKRHEAEFEEQLERAKAEVRAAVQREAQQAVDEARREAQQTAQLYAKESKLRRELHNRLVELQGNIRVLCRVRPIQPHEATMGADVTSFPDKDVVCLAHTTTKQDFEFEHVFQPDSTQQEVFVQTCPLVVSVLDGYNVCIFAYGQTGSGKTYTMDGPAGDPGVNQRALAELFRLRDERATTMSYTFHITMLEVYNESIVDLLDDVSGDAASRAKLDVRVGKEGVFIPGLVEVEVMSMEDVNELLTLGVSNRSVGAHNINEHSSRSHLVFAVRVEGHNRATGSTTQATLNLIDLAGSERLSKTEASGVRLKEAQHINRSLSALGDVVAALGNGSKHVPYRNSKLTFLLQNSLSGNSKVLMIVNVSPVLNNMSESVCSLNFASRCRSVALGQATANVRRAPPRGAPSRPSMSRQVAASPGRALLSGRSYK